MHPYNHFRVPVTYRLWPQPQDCPFKTGKYLLYFHFLKESQGEVLCYVTQVSNELTSIVVIATPAELVYLRVLRVRVRREMLSSLLLVQETRLMADCWAFQNSFTSAGLTAEARRDNNMRIA